MSATRIFHNGKIYTVNKNQPWAEAVVLDGDKIVFVGSNEEALAMKGADTQVQDLEGKMMMPGFIDGHVHPLMAAAFSSGIKLDKCNTKEEILATVKEYVEANPDKDAYFGQGWLEEIFADANPLADDLDAICADKPMILLTASCHGAWCNHKAFEVAGIDKNTPDITPGSNYFARDEEGNPSGRCFETCYFVMPKYANYFPQEDFKQCVLDLGNYFASLGYTSFADIGDYEFITNSLGEDFAEFINSDEFPQRFFGGFYFATNRTDMLQALSDACVLKSKFKPTDKLGFVCFKILGDGVAEARTAAMVQPYDNGAKVETNFTIEEASRMALMMAANGFDINIHGIGDAATKFALDVAQALREAGFNDTRITISHSQCFVPGDVERAGKLNVFINSTGAWHNVTPEEYKEMVGLNMTGHVYPIRSLIDVGCKYGQGTDYPVSDGSPCPFESIDVGIRRRKIGYVGPDPSDLCEAPTLEESIESFTINNAYQIRMEDKLGSIEVGKLADMIVVDKNLFEIPVEDIHTVKVLETVRGGQTVYKA